MDLKRTGNLRKQAIPRGYSVRWGACKRLRSARQRQGAGPEHVSTIVARVMAALRAQHCLSPSTQLAPLGRINWSWALEQAGLTIIPTEPKRPV